MKKKCIFFMLLITVVPAVTWAQAPNNEELYQMIQEMERKLEAAIEDAKKAKEELARIKGSPAVAETARTESVEQVPETKERFRVFLEALNMRPSRNNLDFVVVDPDGNSDSVKGKYKSVQPEYSWGGRVAMNYRFGSGSDIGLKYMWLDTEEDESISRDDFYLWGTWLHPNAIIDDNDVTDATAKYEFRYHVIDFGGGHWVNFGENFELRVGAGLRRAVIDQEFDIEYLQVISSTLQRRADIEYKNEFSGWGPRVGLDLNWKMPRGFNIFGSIGGSLLVGDFKMKLKELDWPVSATTPTTRLNVEENLDSHTVPVIDSSVGIGYSYHKNGRTYGAKIGYEWQNWFNMVIAKRGSDDVDSQIMDTDTTDIGLDGFFFEGYVSF